MICNTYNFIEMTKLVIAGRKMCKQDKKYYLKLHPNGLHFMIVYSPHYALMYVPTIDDILFEDWIEYDR